LIAISIYLRNRSITKVFEENNTGYASVGLTPALEQILGLEESAFILLQQNKMDLEPGRSVDILSVKKSTVNSVLLCLPILQRSCIEADQRLE